MSGLFYSVLLLCNLSNYVKSNRVIRRNFPGSKLFEGSLLTPPEVDYRCVRSFKSHSSSEKHHVITTSNPTFSEKPFTTENVLQNSEESLVEVTTDKNLSISQDFAKFQKKLIHNFSKKKKISQSLKNSLKNKYDSIKEDNVPKGNQKCSSISKTYFNNLFALRENPGYQGFSNYIKPSSYGISGFPNDIRMFKENKLPNYLKYYQTTIPSLQYMERMLNDTYNNAGGKNNSLFNEGPGLKLPEYIYSRELQPNDEVMDSDVVNENMYDEEEMVPDDWNDYQYNLDSPNTIVGKTNQMPENSFQQVFKESNRKLVDNFPNQRYPQMELKSPYNMNSYSAVLPSAYFHSAVFPNMNLNPRGRTLAYNPYVISPLTHKANQQLPVANMYPRFNTSVFTYPSQKVHCDTQYQKYFKHHTGNFTDNTVTLVSNVLKNLGNYLVNQENLQSKPLSKNYINSYIDYMNKVQSEIKANTNI